MPGMSPKVRRGLPLRATQDGRHGWLMQLLPKTVPDPRLFADKFFNVSAMWMLVQTRGIWGIVVGLSSFILMQEVNVIADYVLLNLESKSL